MIALLVVANQYKLNPFTREIYAFPTDGGIVPILGVDGWMRITNEHPMFNGMRFEYGPSLDIKNNKDEYLRTVQEYVDRIMYRKDRAEPIVVREYYVECTRDTGPWREMPRRMLRHKALMQCARYAFGFAGVYDEDDAEVISANSVTMANDDVEKLPNGRVHHRKPKTTTPPAEQTVDKPATEPAPQDNDPIDAEFTAKPDNPNEDILRQEIMDEIEVALAKEDTSDKVLAEIGDRLATDRVKKILGEESHAWLKGLWIKRCEAGEVKDAAVTPKKRLF
jgi:phage recombination protein Bet